MNTPVDIDEVEEEEGTLLVTVGQSETLLLAMNTMSIEGQS